MIVGKVNKVLQILPVIMAKTYRVNRTQLEIGTRVERTEHPWASLVTARRIARDHLRESPMAYPAKKKN